MREPLIPPLSPGDIKDVIQFLDSRQDRATSPDAVARGSKILSTRGGCYDCHGGDARGEPSIGAPNLSDRIWLYGGDFKTVFDSIAYGRAGYCPAWYARLSALKIREAALYVFSLSHPSPSRTSPSAP